MTRPLCFNYRLPDEHCLSPGRCVAHSSGIRAGMEQKRRPLARGDLTSTGWRWGGLEICVGVQPEAVRCFPPPPNQHWEWWVKNGDAKANGKRPTEAEAIEQALAAAAALGITTTEGGE